jgi:hypothetical protein
VKLDLDKQLLYILPSRSHADQYLDSPIRGAAVCFGINHNADVSVVYSNSDACPNEKLQKAFVVADDINTWVYWLEQALERTD